MDNGTVDDALETRRRLRFGRSLDNEGTKLGVEVLGQAPAQLLDVDIAGPQDGGRVAIVDDRQQQMLERCVLMGAFVGELEGTMERSFQAL
jgi:hypothetical protein